MTNILHTKGAYLKLSAASIFQGIECCKDSDLPT